MDGNTHAELDTDGQIIGRTDRWIDR